MALSPLTAEQKAKLAAQMQPSTLTSLLDYIGGGPAPVDEPAPAPEPPKYTESAFGTPLAGEFAVVPKVPQPAGGPGGAIAPSGGGFKKLVVPPPAGYEGIDGYKTTDAGQLVTPDYKMAYQPAPGGGGKWVMRSPPGVVDIPTQVIGPEDAAPPPAPSDVVQVGKPGAPMAPLAGAQIPPPPAPKPMPMGGGGVPALPAAPASAPLDVPTYKGMDPYAFLTPGQKKQLSIEGRSMYGQGEYAKQSSDVDSQLAADYDATAQKIAADADAQEQAALAKAAKRKAFLDRFNAETEKQITDYTKAEIKPDRLWSGGSGTANAITAMVGSLLSGLAGYLDPSKDYVGKFAERIDQKVQQDIDLQKAEIAKKGAGIEARRGLYGSYLQQFGQEDAADAMAHETYLRKIKSQVDAYAAKASSEKTKIQASALSAAIDDKIALWQAGKQAAGEQMVDAYLTKQEQAKAAAAAYAASELKKRNDAIFKAQLDVGSERAKKIGGTVLPLTTPVQLPTGAVLPAGSVVVYDAKGQIDMEGTAAAEKAGKMTSVNIPVPGADGGMTFSPVPVPESGAKDVAKQASGAAKAMEALQQMATAADMPGPWVGKKFAMYQAALANYTTYYGVANDMGAISSEEGKRIALTTVPTPTWGAGYMTDAERAKIDSQKVTLGKSMQSIATAYGPPSAAGPAPLPLKPAGK